MMPIGALILCSFVVMLIAINVTTERIFKIFVFRIKIFIDLIGFFFFFFLGGQANHFYRDNSESRMHA